MRYLSPHYYCIRTGCSEYWVLLLYPHWLFGVLGVIGATLTYLSTKDEDKRLIEKFGDAYREYMQRVPGMNFLLGIIRLWRRQ